MKAINSKNSSESTHAATPFLSGDKKGSFFPSFSQNHHSFFGPSAIQPKLEIGQPNDKYEREADRVADTVMRMPDNSVNKPAFFKSTQSIIQKQVPSPDAEPQVREGTTGDVVEAVVAIPEVSMFLTSIGNDFLHDVGSAWDESLINKFGLISGGLGIAGGLGLAVYAARNDPEALDLMVSPLSGTVIPPFDFDFFPEALRSFALEVNFDRYDENRSGRNIMGGLHFDVGRWLPPILGFGPVNEWNPIGAPSIQPKCKGCEEEEKLQKKSDGRSQSTNPASSNISNQLSSKAGAGNRLPKPIRSEMAHKMGADFSGVNIHTGPAAHKLSNQLGARAFTYGSDIYFNKGEYNPDSSEGKHLLAHELTHVVQQESNSNKAFIRRQISQELLIQGITRARIENLMILYLDSYRRNDTQTPFFESRQGIGRRDAYSDNFIRRRQTRSLILREYTGGIQWLINQRRWDALYWLYYTFPERHVTNASSRHLDRLRSIIEEGSRAVQVEDSTGWEQIQNAPPNALERRVEEESRQENNRQRAHRVASNIREALRVSSGDQAYLLVFSTAMMRDIGGHAHGLPNNWAEALVRYIRTINELRKGEEPSVSGTIPNAPVTITAYMVDRAKHDYHSLTDKEILRDDNFWANIILPELWSGLRERFIWGTQRADYDVRFETFMNGRYRNPSQGLF